VIEPRRGGGPAPYPFMEYDVTENALLALCPPPPLATDGTIALPGGPGTGIELTPQQLEPWIVSHWSEKLA